jgi:hypothetical protein
LYCQELGEIINIIPFILSGAWRDNKYYSICIVRSLERFEYKWNNIYYLSKLLTLQMEYYLLSLQAPDNTNGIILIKIINSIPFVVSGAWRDNKYYSICIVRSLER